MVAKSFHVFSPASLARVIRASDSTRFGLSFSKGSKALLEDISKKAMDGAISFSSYQHDEIRGKRCVSYQDFDTHLVLRSMTKVLTRQSGVSTKSRERIVRGVVEALLDSTPLFGLRLDIKSFYETVQWRPLKENMLADTSTSSVSRAYLSEFFNEHCKADLGIPRGVGLSALLSELALRDFDKKVREISGVYRYFRFADDILILSFLPIASLAHRVEEFLPNGMKLNLAKTQSFNLTNIAKKPQIETCFEYLGYSYSVSNAYGKGSRDVHVEIAKRKINKIKSRLILTVKDFGKTGDFNLLYDRIAFLTGNFKVRRNGLALTGAKTNVKSGIFYNYRLCGIYTAKNIYESITYGSGNLRDTKALDGFLFSLTRGKTSNLGKILDGRLSSSQKQALWTLSFNAGFSQKLMVRYAPDRINEIKVIWKNV